MAKAEKKPRVAPTTTRTTKTRLTGDIARAVRAALDKKALDVVVLDLRHTPAFTDFFLLCYGQNTRQVRPSHVEGYGRAEWILMDFFTFIVHVFSPQTRDFYSLERLWGDAERIEMSDEPPPPRSH